jgi:hypothetical protein
VSGESQAVSQSEKKSRISAMRRGRKCQLCGEAFSPDKYHPRQKFCTSEDCREERRRILRRRWLAENPDYYKRTDAEREIDRLRCRKWRAENPDYYRGYRATHGPRINKKRREWYSRKRKYLLDAVRHEGLL